VRRFVGQVAVASLVAELAEDPRAQEPLVSGLEREVLEQPRLQGRAERFD
jgi:hypothetical protein